MRRILTSTKDCGLRCSALTASLSSSADGSVMWSRVASVSDIGSAHCRDASNTENLPGPLFGKKARSEAKNLTVVPPKNNHLWFPVPFETKLKANAELKC